MRVKPIIWGVVCIIFGGFIHYFALQIKGIAYDNVLVKKFLNTRELLLQAQIDCTPENFLDINDPTLVATKALINLNYGKCSSIEANYVVNAANCATNIFNDTDFCGACTSIAEEVKKWDGTAWVADETEADFKYVQYTNLTLPALLHMDYIAFATDPAATIVSVVPALPTEPAINLYPTFTNKKHFPYAYLQKNGSDHTCYSATNAASVKALMATNSGGLTSDDQATVPKSNCSEPTTGDYRISAVCLGMNNVATGKERVMGGFYYNATAGANLFLPHTIPYLHKWGCETPSDLNATEYHADCQAKWIWHSQQTDLTNHEIIDQVIDQIDDGIYAAWASKTAGLVKLANMIYALGLITIISGLICKPKVANEAQI